jgi:hypothetical protein
MNLIYIKEILHNINLISECFAIYWGDSFEGRLRKNKRNGKKTKRFI